jgi:hypothetical protein
MSNVQNNLRLPVRYGSRESIDETARLPKTMAHWFRDYGVVFDVKSGTGYGVRRTMKAGCGSPVRYFRALPHLGLLQICDGYFDRWANSIGAETSLPKTRAEFVAAMEREIAELQDENLDLEAHVLYFGRSERWIKKLWSRYQWRLSFLRAKRQYIVGNLKFQRMRFPRS